MVLSISALPGATITWYYNGSVVATNTTSYTTTGAGEYVVQVTYPGGCIGRDTFNLTLVPSIPVNLGPDRVLCAGDPPPLLDAGITGAQYLWTLNGVPIATTQTLLATQSGTYAVIVSNGLGCSGRDSVDVSYTNFTVNLGPDIALCASSVTLDAGPQATTCQWLLNNSPYPATGCQINVSTSGTYTVIAQNANGCTASDQIQVTLGSPITAQFSGPASGQVGQPLTFNDLTTPAPTSRTWNFGDGSAPVSGVANPTHTYTRAGYFPVVLSVSNGLCTDTTVQYVDVRWDCATQITLQAAFTMQPNPVDLATGGTVFFTNTSTGATAYWWHFGVGNDTSNAVNPSYAYSAPGTYTVELVARNYNCTDTARQTITVLRAEPSALHAASQLFIQVYPNPVSDYLYLKAQPPYHFKAITGYNLLGQSLFHLSPEGEDLVRIDFTALPAGHYLLQVSLVERAEPLYLRVWHP
jgi:PKD repeat protein